MEDFRGRGGKKLKKWKRIENIIEGIEDEGWLMEG